MKHATIFAQITKADAVAKTVTGVIAAQQVDASGELMLYGESKPYFQAWSDNIAKATGGKSVGNVRLMHKADVGGKLVDLSFDDAAQTITATAKVTDAAWPMVEEGMLTGFSIGGSYVSKAEVDGVTSYVVDPCEVSLVDNPCLKAAFFDLTKADGVVQVELVGKADKDCDKSKDDMEADANAGEKDGDDEKQADEKPKVKKNVNAEDIGVVQRWVFGTQQFETKADAMKAATATVNPLLEALNGVTKADPVDHLKDTREGLAKVSGDLALVQEAYADTPVMKGLWSVGRLACIIEDVGAIARLEGFDAMANSSTTEVPMSIIDGIKSLGEALISMAQEGIADCLESAATYTPAARADDVIVLKNSLPEAIKAGARNNRNDADRVQAMCDLAIDLGAVCKVEPKLNEEMLVVKGERDQLKSHIDEAMPVMKSVKAELESLRAEVTKLKAQPSPMPGTVVEKGATSDLDAMLADMTPEQIQSMVFKAALSKPQSISTTR